MGYVIGFYIAIALVCFAVTMFFAVLGGKDSDLWKPFIYGPLWIIFFPIKLAKALRD